MTEELPAQRATDVTADVTLVWIKLAGRSPTWEGRAAGVVLARVSWAIFRHNEKPWHVSTMLPGYTLRDNAFESEAAAMLAADRFVSRWFRRMLAAPPE